MEETAAPFLFVGFGNPGREYRETRHNIGFMLVDRVAQSAGIVLGKVQGKAIIGLGKVEGRRVVLAKPQTFMNLSGQSVSSLIRFYKIPLEQVLVAHDDLDLPLGTLRLRPGGGSAGQKGVASTIQQLGTQEFGRMRLGIGRPPGQMQAADYVLQAFAASEQMDLTEVLDRGVAAFRAFVTGGMVYAMNQFNGTIKESTNGNSQSSAKG